MTIIIKHWKDTVKTKYDYFRKSILSKERIRTIV